MKANGEKAAQSFRVLDSAQCLLFSALVCMLTSYSMLEPVFIDLVRNPIWVNYTILAILSVLGIAIERGSWRHSMCWIILLSCSVAIIGNIAINSHHYYHIHNTVICIIGNISFLVFAASNVIRLFGKTHVRSKRMLWNNIPPLLDVLAIVLLTAIAASLDIRLAAAGIVFCILIYALRIVLTFNSCFVIQENLVRVEQARSRLLIDMIHEIRAPLASIVLNASMLRRANALENRQKRWIEQISKGSVRVTSLLNSILEIEKVDAGLFRTQIKTCDLNGILQTSIDVVREEAMAAGIDIETDVKNDFGVFADKDMLDRVFVNILTNAVRFTAFGGKILIRAAIGECGFTVIRIVDTGVGIAAELQPMLFVRFSRLGAPIRGVQGSGLGLSICRSLMLAMGGTIAIKSELGKGTIVKLALPPCDQSIVQKSSEGHCQTKCTVGKLGAIGRSDAPSPQTA